MRILRTPIFAAVSAAAGATILWVLPSPATAQIVSPAPGVKMPQAYFDRVARDPRAFQLDKAWIAKTERAKDARRVFFSEAARGGMSRSLVPPPDEIAVAGTMRIAVIAIKYANTAVDPYPTSALQAKLFNGLNPTGTVTELYDEMSYGQLTMTGTVYPASPSSWVQASQNDTYYEGGANGLNACVSHTGGLILEALQAADPAVNFATYDNDGPDGTPNSGDDDGFVDLVTIVHPELGGECGTSNMWAHRWNVGGWPEFSAVYDGSCQMVQPGIPYMTNDARSGGGFIRIWDYVMTPGQGAGNGCQAGITEIGVFSHEFGHSFGLPDLYDTNGGGQGIGVHCLMGAGNWNRPTNPPHMSAWCKLELGWVTPIVVAPDSQMYSIRNVEQNPDVYQLGVIAPKFGRQSLNPISGSYSLRCGLDNVEAGARNWPGGAGYGNGWAETAAREFDYDGSGPVTLVYDVSYQTEASYDFGRIKIQVNNVTTPLAAYTGAGVAPGVSLDLTPHLSGSGASRYRIIAEFTSDRSWSDEDNGYNSLTAGPFKIDNVSVTGGGESYFTDFETDDGGWSDTTPSKEYFLVENRSKAGRFDQFLNAEGLYVWHIEQNVAHSILANTGGTSSTSNLRPAGVTLMEADGFRNLLLGQNRGDPGDAFPGSSNNRRFDNTTNPDSRSHNNTATRVLVTAISNPGSVMTAIMRGDAVSQLPPPGPGYSLALYQNVPNPFNPTTSISFSLQNQGQVSLAIFDVKGRLVTTLINGVRQGGPNQITWDGTNAGGARVASGVYFCRLSAGGQSVGRKMILVR